MSDFNSAQPIRTENNGAAIISVCDPTITTQIAKVSAAGEFYVIVDNLATTTVGMNLTQVGGTAITLGQKAMASSIPVTIASDQSHFPIELQDGAGNNITSQVNGTQRALDVGLNVAGVQIDPRQIRALVSTTDSISCVQSTSPWIVQDLADGSVAAGTAATKSMLAGLVYNSASPTLTTGQQVALQGDSSGNLKVNIATSATLSENLAQVGGSSITLGQKTMANSLPVVIASDQSGITVVQSVAANFKETSYLNDGVGNAITSGIQGSARALDVELNSSGAVVSSTNPLPVTITSSTPGLAIQNYQTAASIAAGASTTFTYTVAASHTFNLQRVWTTASGKIKTVVQLGSTTIMVGFNSTSSPNIDMTIVASPTIAAAGTVNVIISNLDKSPMDVYATIEGNQN
jgi:hypothetical protein